MFTIKEHFSTKCKRTCYRKQSSIYSFMNLITSSSFFPIHHGIMGKLHLTLYQHLGAPGPSKVAGGLVQKAQVHLPNGKGHKTDGNLTLRFTHDTPVFFPPVSFLLWCCDAQRVSVVGLRPRNTCKHFLFPNLAGWWENALLVKSEFFKTQLIRCSLLHPNKPALIGSDSSNMFQRHYFWTPVMQIGSSCLRKAWWQILDPFSG